MLSSALHAVNQPMPDLAWHGADFQSGHNFEHRAELGGVSNTARCLFLDRFVRVPGLGDRGTLPFRRQVVGADNYFECLNLDTALLESWKGKTILDLGCGYSLFYAEVNVVFGANVVPLDMHKRDPAGEREAIRCYIENMFYLRALIEFNKADQCLMQTINVDLFKRTFARIGEIIQYYLSHKPRLMNIITDDLSGLYYEGVISCFMFCYFEDADRTRNALINLCRGMRVSGWLRICVGQQGINSARGILNEDLQAVNEVITAGSMRLVTEDVVHYRFCLEIKLKFTGLRGLLGW